MFADKKAYQERLDRIADIFSDVVANAEISSLLRCPYRDQNDYCTALFRCRNQLAVEGDSEELACGHTGEFDYRTAWESQPRARERVKRKIADIKRDAEERRRRGDSEGTPS